MFLAAPIPQINQPVHVQTASQQNQAPQNTTGGHLPISPSPTLSPDHLYRRQLTPPVTTTSQMDNRAGEYSQQPGLPSPYPSAHRDSQSESSSLADPASAATQYPTQPEVRPNSYSTSATPTSEYGPYPSSARSSSFPDHIQQQRPAPYAPAATHAGGTAEHSVPAPSPSYPPGAQFPSPYGTQEMPHPYNHPGPLYAQPRPDWSNYSQASPITPGHPQVYHAPASAPARPTGQVYSFVPIPGATQHKRPRRRYEEIERMYKCGWNGCEKAYGTLNHLNAHVTMQSHGQKRTPEEFKEIRKEWKARKKEEEAQRKAEEERHRQAQQQVAQNGSSENPATTDPSQPATTYASRANVQLPPIGFSPSSYPAPGSAGVPQQPLPEQYNATQLYPASYAAPTSPYGQQQQQQQQHQNMYNQPGNQPPASSN